MRFIFIAFEIGLFSLLLTCTMCAGFEQEMKRLDRMEKELSAIDARMDSLEFFKLPVVKK